MITLAELPRDNNGMIQGAWRLFHESDEFHGTLGVATMRRGSSEGPVFGQPLQVIVAIYGPSLFMEPWEGDLPQGLALPPLVCATLPEGMTWSGERCPWRHPAPLPDTIPPPPPEEPTEAAAPAVVETTPAKATSNLSDKEFEALSLDELRALAEKLGAEFDGRWTERRLIRAIKAARG